MPVHRAAPLRRGNSAIGSQKSDVGSQKSDFSVFCPLSIEGEDRSTLRSPDVIGTEDGKVRKIHLEFDMMTSGAGRSPGAAGYANSADLLRTRAEMLKGKDKALIQMYLANGSSFGEMARLAGVSESTIARRVRRLTRRLLGSEYIMCLRRRRCLSRLEQAVAKDYFLKGRSQKEIARKREFTVYQVRKALRRLQALVDSEVRRKDDDANV